MVLWGLECVLPLIVYCECVLFVMLKCFGMFSVVCLCLCGWVSGLFSPCHPYWGRDSLVFALSVRCQAGDRSSESWPVEPGKTLLTLRLGWWEMAVQR